MHKVIIDGKEYIEKTEVIRMIYDYVTMNPEQDKLFEDIEKALGFKLFTWQKTYIENGTFRRSGKTLAEILRLLLDVDAEPLDFTILPRNQREHCFRKQLKDIWYKLKDANIPMRKVFWCEHDKRIYINLKQISESLKKFKVPTIPPLCINYKPSHGDEIDTLSYVCGTHHCPQNTPLTIGFKCKGCDRRG